MRETTAPAGESHGRWRRRKGSSGWGDVETHRLRVALAVVLAVAFIVLPSALAYLPTGAPAGPHAAQALPAWDVLTIERNTALAEIIVVGEVTRVDPARWNGSGGKKPGPLSCASWDPMVYATFYVKPTEVLKGVPQWGTPVAFRLEGGIPVDGTTNGLMATLPTWEDGGGGVTLLSRGDTVVVFGQVAGDRYGGGVYDPAGAYWLTMGDSSLWSGPAGASNVTNHGLLRYQDERELTVESMISLIQGYVDHPLPETTGRWTTMHPSGAVPPARFGEALVTLGDSGKILMFGGATDEAHPLSDTWLYEPLHDAWSEAAPAGAAPPARWGMAYTYLPATDRVLVFGGMGADGKALDDTWLYDVAKGRWSHLVTGAAPSPRYQAGAIYDPVTRRVVLFGGRYSQPGFQQDYSDTWALDTGAKTWTQQKAPGAPAGASPGTTWLIPGQDTGTITLLAGPPPISEIGGPVPSIDPDRIATAWTSYTYDTHRDSWTSLGKAETSPPISRFYALAFDSALRQAVVFGGLDIHDDTLAYTWVYDGGYLTNVSDPQSAQPPGRIDAAMAYDPVTHRVVLFGGRTAPYRAADVPADTWVYSPKY